MQFLAPDLEESVKKMTDCNYVMREFLMDQYIVYKYRSLVSFFTAALMMPFILNFFNIRNGSSYKMYMLLFIMFYIVQLTITEIIKRLVDNDALTKLLTRCGAWQNDKDVKIKCKAVVDPDAASAYLKENFTTYTSPLFEDPIASNGITTSYMPPKLVGNAVEKSTAAVV